MPAATLIEIALEGNYSIPVISLRSFEGCWRDACGVPQPVAKRLTNSAIFFGISQRAAISMIVDAVVRA